MGTTDGSMKRPSPKRNKGGRPPIPQETWDAFNFYRGQRGYTVTAAAREVGVSYSSAKRYIESNPHVLKPGQGSMAATIKRRPGEFPDPLPVALLSEEATRARDDFAYFFLRYFGLTAIPWQVKAAETIADLLASPDEEYAIINVPPGAGKSTLFTRGIPLWLIARDRSVRIQIGSKSLVRAKDYTRSIRRELMRTRAQKDALATIPNDFGRFQPYTSELWRHDEFIVEQVDGSLAEDKEPTVMGVSQDADFLGARADFVIWDDLVDTKNSRTIESREALANFWGTMAESRLEPGGLLVLQGQRIGPDDLYETALAQLAGQWEDDERPTEPEYESGAPPRKYTHIVYPAHDEEKCKGVHAPRKEPKPWPKGCLLDPHRLNWRKLSAIKRNDPARYEVVYQQRTTGGGLHLVARDWIEGGTDRETGEQFPGCLDKQRDWWELPDDLGRGALTIVTVDPSPTRFWAIQAWVYDPDTERRCLIYAARRRMGADGLLDSDRTGEYTGELEMVRERMQNLGRPMRTLIVERNAAQNFMTQYRFFTDYLRRHGIQLIKHNTGVNKSDEQYGVQTIASHYRLGRVRLPYKGPFAARISRHLIDEVTVWPDGAWDDQVMAHWFMEWNLPNLKFHRRKHKRTESVPSWVQSSARSWLATAGRS